MNPFQVVQEEEASGAEAYPGSMQEILCSNQGHYVICEFLIGNQTLVEKSGILYAVGVSYLVLYQPDEGEYTVCDLYALKFATFVDNTQPEEPPAPPQEPPAPPEPSEPPARAMPRSQDPTVSYRTYTPPAPGNAFDPPPAPPARKSGWR